MTEVRHRRMEIERDGTKVRFIIHCASDYDAMMLYDSAKAGADKGALDMTIITDDARGSGDGESA